MRIIFMGSPDFAVPSLNALVEAGHDVVAVYSQPPRPAGRGKGERKTTVHERADELGILVRTPKTLRDDDEQSQFRGLDADLAVVAAYGLILPAPILEAPKAGCINVHASLLPHWRGAAPIQRAILAGDEISGVTLMRMDEGLDTGPMFTRQTLDIRGKNAEQVTEEMAYLGERMLVEWLDSPTPPEPQPIAGATYASKIAKAETRIDWSKSAEEIERQVRAFSPSPGAWFEVNDERIKILSARVADGKDQPGLVIGGELATCCGDGVLIPLSVQRAGKKPMHPSEMLRGFPIPEGTILP
jgi:methionyl-tRNA formyltransferase